MNIVLINNIPLIVDGNIVEDSYTFPFYRVINVPIDMSIDINKENINLIKEIRGYFDIFYICDKSFLKKADKCFIDFKNINLLEINRYTVEVEYDNWIIASESEKEVFDNIYKKTKRNNNINYLLNICVETTK